MTRIHRMARSFLLVPAALTRCSLISYTYHNADSDGCSCRASAPYLADQTKGLPPEAVDKLRKMLAFLQDVESVDELRALPAWKAHRLKGGRAGTRALHVTRNWRLTCRIENNELIEVDYEDCH